MGRWRDLVFWYGLATAVIAAVVTVVAIPAALVAVPVVVRRATNRDAARVVVIVVPHVTAAQQGREHQRHKYAFQHVF